MRVNVSFTVDVDEEAWSQEYGVQTAAEIRADVKRHVSRPSRRELRGDAVAEPRSVQ